MLVCLIDCIYPIHNSVFLTLTSLKFRWQTIKFVTKKYWRCNISHYYLYHKWDSHESEPHQISVGPNVNLERKLDTITKKIYYFSGSNATIVRSAWRQLMYVMDGDLSEKYISWIFWKCEKMYVGDILWYKLFHNAYKIL